MAENRTDRVIDGSRKGAVVITSGAYPKDARLRRAWLKRHAARFKPPSYKRIRRWRDRRLTSLNRGLLIAHRRVSFAAPHKSRQRR